MTTITSTVAAQGVNPTGQPYRNPIHRTSDGYRCVLYSDGTHLRLATSQDGTAWTIFPTAIAPTESVPSFPRLITSAMTPEALHVFVGHSSGIVDAYRVPYSGAGVWGAATSIAGIVSGLTNVPLSAMAAYDPNGTTVDVDHQTGQTGIIHLLVDCGAIWHFYALDTHTSGVGPKIVCSAGFIPNPPGSTANTNYIVRATGELFAVSPFASMWEAMAVTYTSRTTTANTVVNGPNSLAYNQTVSWYDNASGVAVGTALANNHYYKPSSHLVSGHPVPDEASAAGAPPSYVGYGKLYTAVAGMTYPTGTWTVTIPLTSTNISGNMRLGIRLYDAIKGILLGQIAVQTNTIADGSNTLTCTASLPGFTVTAGSGGGLKAEIDLAPLGLTQAGFSGTLAIANGSIATPTPTKLQSTTTTVNQYTVKHETPTIGLNAAGCSLIPTTDASPGIDLFSVASATAIETQRRTAAGGYGTKTTLPATALDVTSAPSSTMDPVSGEVVVFALATFSGSKHAGYLRKTGSVWGAWTQHEGLYPNDTQSFATADERGLGLAGRAVAWTNSSIPPLLLFDDAGFASGSTGAQKPIAVQIVDSPGVDDAFGTVSPFNAASSRPYVQWVYRADTSGDRMAAYQVIWKLGGTTVDDSGRVAVAGGPLPGATYKARCGTALTVGQTYTVIVYTWDAVTGIQSPASDAITVQIVAVPIITVTAPATVSAQIEGVTFDYWQGASAPGSTYRVRISDANGVEAATLGPNTITVPLVATVLSADAAIGATTIQTDLQPTSGRQIAIGTGAARDVRTAVSSVGSGPYTVTLDAALGQFHPAGVQVAAIFTTDGVQFLPALPNNTDITIAVDVWTQIIASGSSWYGTGTLVAHIAVNAPPAPSALISVLVPGADPLHGGYVSLRFNQDPATGAQPNPALWRLEQREYSTDAWILVGDFPATVGSSQELRAYSAPHEIGTDYAVSSVSADGIASARAIVLDVVFRPRLGLWLNDPLDPASCVELGIMPPGSSLLQWDTTQEKDLAILFGRTKPVATISDAYSYRTASSLTFKLERGYDRACLALLETWDRFGKTLQVRDPYGDMRYVWITAQRPGAYTLSAYRIVSLELQEIDAGSYGLLGVLPA